MSVLVSKNDFLELVCKFKGHIVPETDLEKLKEHPDDELESTCKRCSFEILIKMDPDDHNYYLVSDFV